jgi:uncharacterized membrane protein YhiD involved in acid resistance
MDRLIEALGPGAGFTPLDIIVAMTLAFILSMAVAWVYRITYQSLSYSRSFVHSQILGALVTCLLIMAIGNNLAAGLGILGTLAIIRFRTQIRDPRDIIFLFATLAIGIACGARVLTVAVIGTVFFCCAAIYLHWSPFASRRQYEALLRFCLPGEHDSSREIDRIFAQFCSATTLVAMREAAQGDVIEHSYHVRLRDPAYQGALLDALKKLEQIEEVSLLMQRSTVEI